MFDIFGILKRIQTKKQNKESEASAEIQKKKENYQERKAKIKAFLDNYYEEQQKIENARWVKQLEEVNKNNSICPHCNSNNVIQKIIRTEGEVHGCSSSSYTPFTHYHEGKIDGKIDTFPVNKCNDCGHEWYISKTETKSPRNDFSCYNSISPRYLYSRIEEYLDMKFDPCDITEPYNSLEEKLEAYIKNTSKSPLLKCYKNIPRYMIDYVVFIGMQDVNYLEEEYKRFGWIKGMDEYSYVLPDHIWEIVKKLLDWKENNN